MKRPTEEELRLLRKTPWRYIPIEVQDWLEENDPEWLKVRDYYDSDEYADSEEYEKDFCERYPNCPKYEVIEEPFDYVLNDKLKAKLFLQGKLRALVLPKNEETRKLLENKEAEEFYKWAVENDVHEAMYACEQTYFTTKAYDKIHIHDDENTWFIDAELRSIHDLTCVPEDVGSFRRRTNCHDLDAITRRLDRQGVSLNARPYFYSFEIGGVEDIIDTNLK